MTLSEKILHNIVMGFGTEYIKTSNRDGEAVKIRISNHSANARNNYMDDYINISFVSSLDRNPNNHTINNEFLINEDGQWISWNGEEMGETIASILEDFEIENISI